MEDRRLEMQCIEALELFVAVLMKSMAIQSEEQVMMGFHRRTEEHHHSSRLATRRPARRELRIGNHQLGLDLLKQHFSKL